MYDFAKNLKYRWGPDEVDEPPVGFAVPALDWFPYEPEGWFGGLDSDYTARLWSLPA
jgi:hypothetical protein